MSVTAATPGHPWEQPLGRAIAHRERRQAFWAGRQATQAALAQQGCVGFPLLKSPQQGPLWPSGRVGSISHGGGWAGCLLARPQAKLRAVGLDMEPLDRLVHPQLITRIASPEEQARLNLHPGQWGSRDLAVTCLKEALYKCLQPTLGVRFGFLDASVVLLEGAASLTPADWLVALGAPAQLQGRICHWQGMLLAAVGWQRE